MSPLSPKAKTEKIEAIFERKMDLLYNDIVKMKNNVEVKKKSYTKTVECFIDKFQSKLDAHLAGIRVVRTDHEEYINELVVAVAVKKELAMQEREKLRLKRHNKMKTYLEQVRNARSNLMIKIKNQIMLMKNNAETSAGKVTNKAPEKLTDSSENEESEPVDDPDDELYEPFLKRKPVNKNVRPKRVSPYKIQIKSVRRIR